MKTYVSFYDNGSWLMSFQYPDDVSDDDVRIENTISDILIVHLPSKYAFTILSAEIRSHFLRERSYDAFSYCRKILAAQLEMWGFEHESKRTD